MSFRTCTPVSGLSHALALSVGTMDTSRRQTQAQTLFKALSPVQSGLPEAVPLAVEPHPEAAAWAHNLKGYLRLLHGPYFNPNPYNDHRHFAHAAVISGGWAKVPPGFAFELASGRADVKAGALGEPFSAALLRRFEQLLMVAGFDKRYPVLFDGQGLILDGMHRLRACAAADEQFYFLRLNF